MGGCDFMIRGSGKDAREAYRNLVEEARYESGNGGYTGTIAEKNGFKIVSSEPLTMERARVKANAMMEDNDKWGPAFCIPIEVEEGKPPQWLFFGIASC